MTAGLAMCRAQNGYPAVLTKELPFGSFVESDGCTGLAPQQSWPVGTRVSVRILAIDPENQRFSLAAA